MTHSHFTKWFPVGGVFWGVVFKCDSCDLFLWSSVFLLERNNKMSGKGVLKACVFMASKSASLGSRSLSPPAGRPPPPVTKLLEVRGGSTDSSDVATEQPTEQTQHVFSGQKHGCLVAVRRALTGFLACCVETSESIYSSL